MLGTEESCSDEARRALSAHVEEGYLQAERGELIDGEKARRDIQMRKDDWRLKKAGSKAAITKLTMPR